MSYRKKRPTVEEQRDSRWLDAHSEELHALGIPSPAYSSSAQWHDFIWSGAVDEPYHFVFYEQLSIAQQEDLRAFLEREYGAEHPVPSLLAFLRERGSWLESERKP